ncbi:MAG: hypothetical protein QM648_09830 [Solirubrobacterales bacterium]
MRWSAQTRPVWIAFAAVFVLGIVVFGFALRHETKLQLSESQAVKGALADPDVASWLKAYPPTRADVIPLDRENARVSFFKGQRAVAEVAVSPQGQVIAAQYLGDDYIRAGGPTIQKAFVLAVGALLFLLLLARRPFASIQNADLLALALLTFTIWSVNQRLFGATMIVGVALMAYLLARCLFVAARPAAGGSLEFLVSFGENETRLLRLIAGAIALLAAMAAIPGGRVGDVAEASMSGATQLLDGNVPYGHIMEGIVHGDTYPVFAYLLYAPAALIMPVHDLFDNIDGALWISAIALIAGAVALLKAGRAAADEAFGLRNAAAWLIFPPALVAASAGSNDLPTAGLIAWSIAAWAHAGRTSTWMSAAAWAKVAPVFVLPLWLARFRGTALRRALIPPVVLTLAMLALLLALGGASSVHKMIDAIAFQSDRGAQLSFWVVTSAPALQVAVQAAGFALAAAAAVAVWRSERLAASLPRLSALAAALLLAFEIGASYWSYAYLPWVYPLVVVGLLWPAARERAASD